MILVLILTWGRCSAQYGGGDNDGHGLITSAVLFPNNQGIYCSGGANDGHGGVTTGIMYPNVPSIYTSGGIGDGYTMEIAASLQPNMQSLYCSGGANDGHGHVASGILYANTQNPYCSGGNSDGHAQVTSSPLFPNSPGIYCNGGNDDGYALVTSVVIFPNSQIFYCSGGNSDGHALFTSARLYPNIQNLYCNGGNSDGHGLILSSVIPMGTGIWRGLASNAWSSASNWVNNIVPVYPVNVLIPPGCPYYPSLAASLTVGNASGTFQCRNLLIQDGAMLTNSSSLDVYETMTVEGLYIGNSSSDGNHQIHDGGRLVVASTGNARLGNQPVAPGTCDLLIRDGGLLSVTGGFLDIDDQLNIDPGGTFNMTSGSVFIHKYGIGSDYSVSFPGSLFVDLTANGNISGGTVKVNGKATAGNFCAVNILSEDFRFTGNAKLEITDGIYATWDETEIRLGEGVWLNDLIVNKPLRVVKIGSDAFLSGDVTIQPGAILSIANGNSVTVQGDVTLEQSP